jgi:hypothetical protein
MMANIWAIASTFDTSAAWRQPAVSENAIKTAL